MKHLNGSRAARPTAATTLRKSPLASRRGVMTPVPARLQRLGSPRPPLPAAPAAAADMLVVPQNVGPAPELGEPGGSRKDVLMAVFAAAVHHERQRLARALHDDLAQSLFIARLRLSTILLTNRDDGIADALRVISECLSSSTKATREIMADLSLPLPLPVNGAAIIVGSAPPLTASAPAARPHSPGLSLRAALVAVTRRVQRQFGLMTATTHEACALDHQPDSEVTTQICSAVRELLINIVKHAGVKTARLHLACDDRMIQVRVEDDGSGFDPACLTFNPTAEGGFGLHSIKKVLAATGGHLQLTSAVGRGTKATLLIPVPPTGAALRDPHK